MTSYSMRPGRAKRIARRWAPMAIWAARRSSRLLGAALVEAHVVEHVAERYELLQRPGACAAHARASRVTHPSMRGSKSRCVPME